MTLKEALQAVLRGEYAKADEVIIEALEKQAIIAETSDKYRWHNLRKDPEDLPERALSINGKRTCNESDDVMAYDGIYYYIAEYDYRREVWLDTMEYRVIRNPLAWREIEPFEEIQL